MKKSAQLIILSLITLLLGTTVQAAGYTHELYLCDIGIMNTNHANQQGVDFIQYLQNSSTRSISATASYSSAIGLATTYNSSFDRWNSTNAITDVSINLESDFYGAEYYLEYCYTWDRIQPIVATDLVYETNFITTLPNLIPNTSVKVDNICSIKTTAGYIYNNQSMSSFTVYNLLTTDLASMRCTIRINFKEDSFITSRPHNGGSISADPNVTIRVTP